MKKYIFLISSVLLLASCSKPLYKYHNYDEAAYKYCVAFENKDIRKAAKSYKEIVEENKKKSSKNNKRKTNRIPPGACADYAYLLLMQQDTAKAKAYFLKEKHLYPESTKYIDDLQKQLGL